MRIMYSCQKRDDDKFCVISMDLSVDVTNVLWKCNYYVDIYISIIIICAGKYLRNIYVIAIIY